MKYTLSWFIIIAVIVGGVWFFWNKQAVAPIVEAPVAKLPANMNPSEMIEVTGPANNAQITSPLTLTGRARGPWYFEASFPIELQDNNRSCHSDDNSSGPRGVDDRKLGSIYIYSDIPSSASRLIG